MAVDPILIVGIIGVTAILGYIANMIFERTKVADIVWLLIFGMALSQFGIATDAAFFAIAPILAAVALLIILFDAGLNLEFYEMVHNIPRSFALGIIGFVLSMAAVAGVYVALGFDLLNGLLLGAILGGTSSAIVISIVAKLRMNQNVRTILSMESILTDPLVIVVSLAIIGIIVPASSSVSPLQSIASAFSVGAVIGLIIGVIWLRLLEAIKGRPYDYILTLGAAFTVYTIVEFAGGSGAIAALFFGLALGNGKTFSHILRMGKEYSVAPLMKKLHGEITFFIRAFFFVLLGIIVTVNPTYLMYGLAIAAAVIVVRFIAARIASTGMQLPGHEKNIMAAMAPRGLAAAVLAQLVSAYGVPGADAFVSITFVVIFATVIYTTIAALAFSRHHKEGEALKPVEKILEEEKKEALATKIHKSRARKKAKRKSKGLIYVGKASEGIGE